MADTIENAPAQAAKKDASTTSGASANSQVRDPDALQSGMLDIWGWLEKHAKLIAALIGIGVLAAVVSLVMSWYGTRQERKAQEAYFAVESKHTKIKEGFDRAKFKALMPNFAQNAENSGDKTADAPASGDLAKDFGSLLGDLEKVAREFPHTAAGAQAAILAGETYLSYGKPDAAIEIAQVPVKALNDKNLMGMLSRILWGSALASKGSCGEAVKVWQPILDNKTAAFFHGDVGLRSGLCYESMNEMNKAREMYQRVTTDAGADSASSSTAKGLLRALDVKMSAPARVDKPS